MIRRHSDLPLERDSSSRFMPWIIAFMVFLAVLSLTSAMVLNSAVSRWTAGLTGTLTVQIIASEEDAGADLGALSEKAAKVLQATPGVEGIRILSEREVSALLEPWLGTGETFKDLPLPRLIDVTIDESVEIDQEALAARLTEVAPGATVDDHRKWLADLITLVRSVELFSAGIVLLTALIAIVTVIFAARTGLAVHHHVIELLHIIGARDSYIARQFQYHALTLGLRGGLLGLGLALVALYGLSQVAGQVQSRVVPELSLSAGQWVVLAGLPLVTAVIAMLTARITVLRTLARLP